MTKTNPSQEWEKDWDDVFGEMAWHADENFSRDAKAFIAQLIAEAEQRTARSGKKMYEIGYKDGAELLAKQLKKKAQHFSDGAAYYGDYDIGRALEEMGK